MNELARQALTAVPALPAGDLQLSPSLTLSVLPPRATVLLQVPARALARAPAVEILSTRLPHTPNTWSGEDPLACWVAPDEWLMQSQRLTPQELIAATRAALNTLPSAVTDYSHARLNFRLAGADAPSILARGSAVNLAEEASSLNLCVSTRLAQCRVLIRVAARHRFELIVDACLSLYLHDWLLNTVEGLRGGTPVHRTRD